MHAHVSKREDTEHPSTLAAPIAYSCSFWPCPPRKPTLAAGAARAAPTCGQANHFLTTLMKRKSLCIYCGSNPGRQAAYLDAARALGTTMARRGIELVYGGASVGLMGAVADAALAAGGRVTGIIPESLVQKELAHNGLTQLHVTQSMHERKRMMADLSDGFIAMPGGAGTLEELFEVWTWAQLGHHEKPCAIYNAAGYYDLLAGFLDHTVAEQFVKPEHRQMLVVEQDPAVLLDRLEAYEAPRVTKWIGRGQT